MKMNFSKDELAMVYQYAAGTKEETLAGLKEIVPVIRDRQTREIVENTIRKLDAIPEPECRRFIADTKQRFIQKRDNSIRRRLAEAKAQARAEKPHPKRKQPDRERSELLPEPQPVDCPSERGRNYTPPEGSVLRPAGGFLRKADDCPQRSGSCQSSQRKLHFPCAG